MANDVIAVLVRLTVVGTLGILLVVSLRALTRRAMGAEVAYWLWLLLPASLMAVLLPRAPTCLCGPETLVHPLLVRGIGAPLDFAPPAAVSNFAPIGTLVWAIGAAVALAYFAYCQRVLRRSLGFLQRLPDGTYRSPAAKQPMVVGAWRPQIVLPSDFDSRYSERERILVLAHERAHLDRHDALTNSIAVALLCLFWFNPLMYWGWNRFRFDQELACDAAALRRVRVGPRHYARALLKTHSSRAVVIAFGWRRRHPLLERIAFLRRPPPSRSRRMMGHSLALMLTLSATYVVWAAPPDAAAPSIVDHPRIAIGLRWFIDGMDVLSFGHGSRLPDMTPRSGDAISLVRQSPSTRVNYSLKCVPSLQPERSVVAVGAQASVHERKRRILIACEVGRENKVYARPVILIQDGETGTIYMADTARKTSLRIELSASTSPSR